MVKDTAPLLHDAEPESAGYHLVQDVPLAVPGTTCGEALTLLRARSHEYSDVIVILDASRRFLGMLSVGELASQHPAALLDSVMQRGVAVAPADTDQEHVATLALSNPHATVPVVGKDGVFLGLVTPQTLLAVLRREHVEDLHRLTGILRETDVARAAIDGPPARRARHRLPWLIVGLAGSALATWVMAHFQDILHARVAIAFFVPGIVYLADAIGTQTEAITVRGLSFGQLHIGRALLRELGTGLLIGAVLGGLAALALWLVFRDLDLALAVGTALLAAGALASGIGLILPWTFHRLGFDPAYGSGPLATVVQDVLSLLVYFACIGLFLSLPE